jgi:hypothetical protein
MRTGNRRRAAVATLALASSALVVVLLFASGFGRVGQLSPGPPEADRTPAAGSAPAAATGPPTFAVVTDNFWVTGLPPGLERVRGGAAEGGGGWVRFADGDRTVEVRVEHGTVAADWETYRTRLILHGTRDLTVRGRPATIGAHPDGGRAIVWLERPGTGAWIRVGDALAADLLAIAVSVRAPGGG